MVSVKQWALTLRGEEMRTMFNFLHIVLLLLGSVCCYQVKEILAQCVGRVSSATLLADVDMLR